MRSSATLSGWRLPRHSSSILTNSHSRGSWVCASCRHHALSRSHGQPRHAPQRRNLTNWSPVPKPYYVTTPIFYVNAEPHVGHLYSMVLADVLKRWQAFKNPEHPSFLCTGTDEYGMKVQRAAEATDIQPKVLCDANAESFEKLATQANISYGRFIRTTDADHVEAVQQVWRLLRRDNWIYETNKAGWYSVSDETFYPENMLMKTVDEITGKPCVVSRETGKICEWVEEKNYHFRLKHLKMRLLQFYEDNPTWIVPEPRMAEVKEWVLYNLEDLSISRPASRLSWGIPVPDDPSQTIYVWVDALVNYLTATGYPKWDVGDKARRWPADVHVIGKDITRFHGIYWPALLMALGLPLPKRLLAHGHWLMGDRKMSKSDSNAVNPFFALDRWGVDAMRYFLIRNGPMTNDAHYSNSLISIAYKNQLQNLGNLLNRTCQSKAYEIAHSIEKAHAQGLTVLPAEYVDLTNDIREIFARLQELPNTVAKHMDDMQPGRALKAIMQELLGVNGFLNRAEPWTLVRDGKMEPLHHSLYVTAETCRIGAILLQPFIPEKASSFLDKLAVLPHRRTLRDAVVHADSSYARSKVTWSHLFPQLVGGDNGENVRGATGVFYE